MALDATQVAATVTAAVSKIAEDMVIDSASTDISGLGTIDYGYIGDGGITIATDRSSNKITALQNSAVVRVASQDAVATYKFLLLQNTKEARELYYGSAEVGGKIAWNPAKMPRGRFVIDYIDTEWAGDGDSGVLYGRHDIGRGQISAIGDIVIKAGEPIGYEVTITAYPDADGVVANVWTGTAPVAPPVAP